MPVLIDGTMGWVLSSISCQRGAVSDMTFASPLQDVTGDIADELCATAPGLFVKDSSGKLEQPVARGNEHHLEKVSKDVRGISGNTGLFSFGFVAVPVLLSQGSCSLVRTDVGVPARSTCRQLHLVSDISSQRIGAT